jgi:beta-lactamase class A
MRPPATVLVVLAVGIALMGAGVTAASMIKPADRDGRGVTAPAGRGGRKTESGAAVPTPDATTYKPNATTPAAASAAATASPGARVSVGICSAPRAYRSLAAKLSADIQGALRGRSGHHAVTVYDATTKVSCHTGSGRHFDSASIVKAIILAALLRWHQETRTSLSAWERYEATLMITQSGNDAATALWNEVGLSRLQHFLNLAKMSETQLGQDGYWGLTQVTAHDEMLLLQLLTLPNSVLSSSSRSYELRLMSEVIPSQRWGTPAGAPHGVTVHVKNGWLPDDTGWHINSIGAFTGKGKNYLIAVLTDDNPSEQYGIDTVEGVARLVHRDLNKARPAAKARLAASVAPSPASTPTAPATGTPRPEAVAPARPAPQAPAR